MGVIFHSWMVHFMDNPMKMDDDWGTPISGTPPYGEQYGEVMYEHTSPLLGARDMCH